MLIALTKKQKTRLWKISVALSIMASILIILGYFGLKPLSLVPGSNNVIVSTSIQSDTADYKTITFNYKSDCGDGTSHYPFGVNNFQFSLGDSNTWTQGLPEYQPNESPFLIPDTYFDSSSVSIIDGTVSEAKCKVVKEGPDGNYLNCGNIPGCTCIINPDLSQECSNGAKITWRIRVTDCQVKGNYTCNNPSGCDVPNFCGINIVFNAYKIGHLPECPVGQMKCLDGLCKTSCNECPTGQTKCSDGICRNDCNQPNYFMIILVIIIIVGLIGGLTYLYNKTRRKR